MKKGNEIDIEIISQAETDKLMKGLKRKTLKGVLISFTDEKKRKEEKQRDPELDDLFWTLPSEQRTYYLVRHGKRPYLLIGMDSFDHISSMAKINSSLYSKGAECLRELIEKVLVDRCYAGVIYIEMGGDCDHKAAHMLKKLQASLPEGIEKIYVFEDAASIICKDKSSLAFNQKTA